VAPLAAGELEPASREVAALPPAAAAIDLDKPTAVEFAAGAATLNDRAKGTMAAVADALLKNPKLRLQIVAYAMGGDDSASQARRLSLSRALAVRSHLIDQGVRSTRMDVRALGNKFEKEPGDRVDLILGNP
jgi:outer membrane protein OmpA-like peptidoglycan-associated protein